MRAISDKVSVLFCTARREPFVECLLKLLHPITKSAMVEQRAQILHY